MKRLFHCDSWSRPFPKGRSHWRGWAILHTLSILTPIETMPSTKSSLNALPTLPSTMPSFGFRRPCKLRPRMVRNCRSMTTFHDFPSLALTYLIQLPTFSDVVTETVLSLLEASLPSMTMGFFLSLSLLMLSSLQFNHYLFRSFKSDSSFTRLILSAWSTPDPTQTTKLSSRSSVHFGALKLS